jgi:hypothetical protein
MRKTWEQRVQEYESQGLTRSDAQAVVDAENDSAKESKRRASRLARAARHAAYTSCGMKRVRGALGGVYYE